MQTPHIVPLIISIAIAVVVALSIFGFLGSGSFFSVGPASPLEVAVEKAPLNPAVAIRADAQTGKYLTDPLGRTLYVTTFPECKDTCLENWPPYYVEGEFKTDKQLGIVMREDTRRAQYTWEGKQLYYFSGDEEPGDMKGPGIRDSWFVVKP